MKITVFILKGNDENCEGNMYLRKAANHERWKLWRKYVPSKSS